MKIIGYDATKRIGVGDWRNPDAPLVPMAVTGHDTIYAWRCASGAPVAEPPSMAVDADGYIADNWREVN